jgi:hypothetical protein
VEHTYVFRHKAIQVAENAVLCWYNFFSYPGGEKRLAHLHLKQQGLSLNSTGSHRLGLLSGS